ncbi:MAG: GerW family sporulation protein [Firmicutes bacterium]|nr:GerW family sporulation protein [Bacillota bacterium]
MRIDNDNHPIERIMDNAMSRIKSFAQGDTILGAPVLTHDGATIIPVSKVSMGFLTGGGEYGMYNSSNYSNFPFAGGSGGGINVTPVAFLVSDGKCVKLIGMDDKNAFEKILDTIPDVLDSLFQDKRKGKRKK